MSIPTCHRSVVVSLVVALVATAAAPRLASGALLPRAGGTMYYDDVLDVTWLGDANAIAGTPYDDGPLADDGRVTWGSAKAWAASLVFGGYSDWRLPTVRPLNGTHFDLTPPLAFDGSKDRGYNVGAPGSVYPGSTASELAYMFFTNLGNLAYYGVDATSKSDPPQPGWGLVNTGPFVGLVPEVYWTGVDYPIPNWAFRFGMDFGVQLGDDYTHPSNLFHAWAVRDGDVAVPEPASLALVGAVVAWLGGRRSFPRVG